MCERLCFSLAPLSTKAWMQLIALESGYGSNMSKRSQAIGRAALRGAGVRVAADCPGDQTIRVVSKSGCVRVIGFTPPFISVRSRREQFSKHGSLAGKREQEFYDHSTRIEASRS